MAEAQMTRADPGQRQVLDFLGSVRAYDPQPDGVERIDTHVSVVFLAGDRAYKIKRAVRYPFLDFSTLEQRHKACLNELVVNRRTAPDLYLDVVPILRDGAGRLSLGGAGEVVEWVVRMRRFDEDQLYERMADKGRLPLAAMLDLARHIAAFHRSADRRLTPGPARGWIAKVIAENEAAMRASPDLYAEDQLADLTATSKEMFARLVPLIERRALSGYVRHCHGDLHLRNIVELDGRPVLFDAIEFDDSIATVDVLNDLAFLLMDLGGRGLFAHANAVLNVYLGEEGSSSNLLGLALLPLFLSLRAAIRSKVEALRASQAPAAAKADAQASAARYFALAQSFLRPRPARLVAIGGLSGSGKSSVARALAPEIGPFPGAVHVSSDVLRKRMFGVAPTDQLPAEAYHQRISDMVYAACRKNARAVCAAGHAAIVDAVHAKPEERQRIEEIAERTGVPFTGIWLDAGKDVLKDRVRRRLVDVSDADLRVVEWQLGLELGSIGWQRIDAGRPLKEVVHACQKVLGHSS